MVSTKIKEILNTPRIICFFFLVGILMSYPIWIPVRSIPELPIFQLPVLMPSWLHWLLSFIFIGCLILYGKTLKRKYLIVFLSTLSIFVIKDQLRWQPWVYQYGLMLIPLLWTQKTEKSRDLITFWQLVIVAVYLWGGVHKIHPNFINATFKSIIGTYFYFLDAQTLENLLVLGYAIPIVEICIAIFLLIPKLRSTAVQLALVSHIFIIAYLGPWGINYNLIVIPWNIGMIFLVFKLFSSKKPIHFSFLTKGLSSIKFGFILILLYFVPVLSAFNLWDHYLSFSLYSNKAPHFYVASEYNSFGVFTQSSEPYVKQIESLRGSGYLDVNAWCMQEMYVPFYPEERVFKQLSNIMCADEPNPEKLLFVIQQPKWNSEKVSSFYCSE